MKNEIVYICGFCNLRGSDVTFITGHEKCCPGNPDVKMCLTCEHAHWNPEYDSLRTPGVVFDIAPAAKCGNPDVSVQDREENPRREPCDCEYYMRRDENIGRGT